ncbi:hypothetical protein DL95DRAFT_482814, partial [Leptodontidium sp. 2 PMI_412]
MRERGSGTVVWVGSVAGWKGDAAGGDYCGSRFTLGGMFIYSFREEVAHLGIKSLLVEPGYCITPTNTNTNTNTIQTQIQTTPLPKHAAMTAYSGHQPDSPFKAAERIIEVVKIEGMESGRPFPTRLVLGSDALKVVKEKWESTLALLGEWEDVGRSTDF